MTPKTAQLEPLLTSQDCARLVQCSPETILEWVAAGEFPDPVVDRPRVKRWRVEDVKRFLTTGRPR